MCMRGSLRITHCWSLLYVRARQLNYTGKEKGNGGWRDSHLCVHRTWRIWSTKMSAYLTLSHMAQYSGDTKVLLLESLKLRFLDKERWHDLRPRLYRKQIMNRAFHSSNWARSWKMKSLHFLEWFHNIPLHNKTFKTLILFSYNDF